VEVDDAGTGLGSDPGGLQVDPDHLPRPFGHPLKHGLSRGFQGQPRGQPFGQARESGWTASRPFLA
jgi:hypothetical protein